MFRFHEVLRKAGITPHDVNMMLHSPRSREGDLITVLPGLVRTRRQAMETYQSAHSKQAERALSKGRPWVASFVKTGPGREKGTSAMLFVGLYRNHGGHPKPRHEIEANPEVQWLHRSFGSFAELTDPDWDSWTWFDLKLDADLEEFQGRLLIEVRLTQSYVRLAENLNAPVLALHHESAFDAAPPPWREMRPSAGMLRALPISWAARLREWRGVYLIVDQSDGMRYVGSAYGELNLLGRWQTHVGGDEGVTALLAERNPSNFRFSILERVSPEMPAEEVIRLERTWMDRLHTIQYGLNS